MSAHNGSNQNHVCVLANHGDVPYKQLRVRGLHISKAFLVPDHRRNVRVQKGTWGPLCLRCCSDANSIMVGHVPRKISAACSLFLHQLDTPNGDFFWSNVAYGESSIRLRTRGQSNQWTIYWRTLIWQFASKTTNPPNLIPGQYFRLYVKVIMEQRHEGIPEKTLLLLSFEWCRCF